MFFDKNLKRMLNVLLLLLIFVSLSFYYFVQYKLPVSVIEGARSRKSKNRRTKKRLKRVFKSMRNPRRMSKRKRRKKQRRKRRNKKTTKSRQNLAKKVSQQKRALAARERKNKKVQEKIRSKVRKGISGGTNISNCAVPYNANLQLGKKPGLFNIFGNNSILKCSKDGTPKFVPAKKQQINQDGIYLINQNKDNTSGQIKYGDNVLLCNKKYKIGGKDSNTKVKYGDNIKMTPIDNPKSDILYATMNPNVHGLSNVKKLKSADYTEAYVTKYQYCGHSGNGDGISAIN